MERTVYSVSVENCPGSAQDSLISSASSRAAPSGEEASTCQRLSPKRTY